MILFDFSQIVMGAAMSYYNKTKEPIDTDLLRHIALNNIIQIKQKYKKEFNSQVVLCLDSRHYWRKDLFPYYKKHREKDREKSDFDWDNFFKSFEIIKEEFKENLPYKVLVVHGAEADDIIATMCMTYRSEEVLIISSDHDFLQLHRLNEKIKQYSPMLKKMITVTTNKYSLFEHVVKGDTGDGIPNIFSDDDTLLVETKRQKPIRNNDLAIWEKEFGFDNPAMFCRNFDDLERFNRNLKLIDLTKIPKDLQDTIIDQFQSQKTNGHKTFNYLIQHKLAKILENGVL
ncbi:MAG: hypothetical protein PHC28_11710 [Flavobacterium sp.]|uniref:hypothetical protein n=1 Tax=Flavobacterium sp. TaxID=239 RepID=UPI00262CA010|nr:hypothetical protein [Flavobacterium sp.]MDD5151119.1 hypothetical protein [Flavobacterium sp.]